MVVCSFVSPPPDWVKPNVPERPEEERKKRGAREGHEAHHRPPPPRIDETREVRLELCPRCGEGLGEPFAIEERVVEAIVPGHVRVTRFRIGRYRCDHCRRVRRARLAPDVAPPRSRFDWGSHFLVGYWSLQGLTTSGLQDLLATNYGLRVSAGTIDAMLRRSVELFAPAYATIHDAVRVGQSVHVGWTVEGDRFLVVVRGEQLRGVPGVHVPLREGESGSPESTMVRTVWVSQAVRKGEWVRPAEPSSCLC